MFFGIKSFFTSVRNRDGTLSVYKSSSMNSIWEPPLIVSFARSVPLNKPFSTISDPAFTEATKALEHLQKSSEIQATLPAYRAHKYRVSNEQTRRNCSTAVSSDGQRAKLKSHTTTKDDLVFPQFLFLFVVFFFLVDGDKRFNAG